MMTFFLLVMLSSNPHQCGQGPVFLSMTQPDTCKPDAGCKIENPEVSDAYRTVCACQPVGKLRRSWTASFQAWSDWPECGGRCLDCSTED